MQGIANRMRSNISMRALTKHINELLLAAKDAPEGTGRAVYYVYMSGNKKKIVSCYSTRRRTERDLPETVLVGDLGERITIGASDLTSVVLEKWRITCCS